MKKKFITLIILFFIPLISTLGYSVWSVVGEINVKPKFNPNSLFYTYLNGQEVEYNGTAQGPVSTDPSLFSLIDGTYTVKYKKVGESKYTTGLPTDAGSYYLYFDHNNDDYTEPSDVLFVIEKATLDTVSISPVYNQSGKTNYFTTDMNTSDITFNATMSNSAIGKIITQEDAEITLDATSLNVGLNLSYNYTVSGMTNYYDYTDTVTIDTYAMVKFYKTNKDNTTVLLGSQDVKPGTSIDSTAIPVAATGYKYDGWYTDSSLTTSFNTSTAVNTNLNLYVKCSLITYYVYTYKNIDEYLYENVLKTYEYNVETGVNIDNLEDDLNHSTYGQYWFNGWVGSFDSMDNFDVYIAPGTTDIVMYGSWVAPITVTSAELDFSSSVRTLSDVQAQAENQLIYKYLNNNEVSDENFTANIVLIHNGYYYSGTKSKMFADDQNLPTTAISTTNIPGSVYLVYIEVSENYVLYDNFQTDTSVKSNYGTIGRTHFIYNTVNCSINGASTLCSIEEALLTGTGTIKPSGDSTIYVESCFSNIDIDLLNKILNTNLSSHSYSLDGRNLYIPYSTATSNYTTVKATAPSSTITYSCLTLCNNTVLTVSSGSNIILSSTIAGSGTVGDRGVLLNYGNINMKSGSNYYSYGFTKGSGLITFEDGSTATDVMKFFDWASASSAIDVYAAQKIGGGFFSPIYGNGNGAFPVTAWSCHNIGCNAKLNYGASYNAFASVWGNTIGYQSLSVSVVGKTFSDSNSCLFKPASNASASDYLIKSGRNSNGTYLTTITDSNQTMGQKDDFKMYGNYIDSSFMVQIKQLTITYQLSTSKTLPIPISYMDVNIVSGSLNISNSSFVFMCGTKLTIGSGASLVIGEGAYIAFDTYANSTANVCPFFMTYCSNKTSAKLVLNGTISGAGSIGGTVDNNGTILIASQSITSIKIKKTASTYTEIKSYNTVII